MFPIYGILGILLLLFSFLLTYLNFYGTFYFNMDMLYALGILLFFDALDFKLNKKSILHHNKKHLLYFILIGGFLGLIIELYREYTSKIWIYANPIDLLNGLLLFLFWGISLLMFYESYVVFSSIFKRNSDIKIKKLSKSLERNIFSILGILGILFLLIPILFYKINSGYFFVFLIFGLWFISEYILYKLGEKSLLKTIFTGNYKPLISLIIASLLVGISWEIRNVLTKEEAAWTYIKPLLFLDYQLFGVPILIILGWPFLYIVFLSFYKIFFRNDKRIW